MAWKLLKYILPGFALALAAGFLVWQIREAKVMELQGELNQAQLYLELCNDTNLQNNKAIDELRNDVMACQDMCSSRLEIKAEVMDRLQYIDSLKPAKKQTGAGGTHEKKEVTGDVDNNDPILIELNLLFGSKGSGEGAVHQTRDTNAAGRTEVLSGGVANEGGDVLF